MRRKLALLFPGQGAQFAGMLGPFLGEPHAQKLIEIAKGALGYDLASIIESPPLASSSLNETQVTQPAILLTSLCNYYAFVKEHPQVANGEWDVAMAGHSIGEYSALAASGVLSPDDAFKLIAWRGYLMSRAKPGVMAAINLNVPKVQELHDHVIDLIRTLRLGQSVGVAAINSCNQLVISGKEDAVKLVEERLTFPDVKKISRLHRINCAFHSPLMRDVSRQFPMMAKSSLISATYSAKATIVSNVTATPYSAGDDLCGTLARQISSPVRWHDSLKYLLSHGYTEFAIMGPQKSNRQNVLRGFLQAEIDMALPDANNIRFFL